MVLRSGRSALYAVGEKHPRGRGKSSSQIKVRTLLDMSTIKNFPSL